mmetsp:Transcript_45415/g.125941  ORF Transcript_45415/g.125941 Transcript_45415/m.125941 type:complete len:222 (-) Transcript_45415:2158-2823(-)
MRSLSSSAPLFTPTLSMASRLITCPNLSICTSRARASSSRSLSSLAAWSRPSTTCSVRSAFCRLRRSDFSTCSSLIRLPSRESSDDGKTSDLERSAGSLFWKSGVCRWRTCAICSVTTTWSSLSLRCLSVWKVWMSASVSRSALSMTFSFLISMSFSFLSCSTPFWNSAYTSSCSSRFSRSSHTFSYSAGSQPGGHTSSSSSSSSSSESKPSSSSSSSSEL